MSVPLQHYLKYKQHHNAVFVACDEKYAFCLYVSLATLIKNSPVLAKSADILVAGYKLTENSKRILHTLPQVKVVDYVYPAPLPDTPAIRNFTAASFARYDCFALLKYYDKILYLDSDVLVQKELADVFEVLPDGLGLIQDPTFGTVGGQFYKPVLGFDMKRMGFNSGFIVLNSQSTWREKAEEITLWCYQKTTELAENLFLPDQGIINLALEKFNISAVALSDLYNCPASESLRKLRSAYIIHSTGNRKFWCYYFRDFYLYYSQWISLGGQKVSIRKGDCKLYRLFLSYTGLDKKVLFQLMPDFFIRPLKAVRFIIKKLLGWPF